jgi:hypothetical protein
MPKDKGKVVATIGLPIKDTPDDQRLMRQIDRLVTQARLCEHAQAISGQSYEEDWIRLYPRTQGGAIRSE